MASTVERTPVERTRVLVVDDDATALMLAQAELEAAGFEVSTRSEALGTMAEMRRFLPHVVLLDVNMPAMDGDSLARLIGRSPVKRAADGREVTLILHSSLPEAELKSRAADFGAHGHIRKGKPGDLATRLRAFVKRRSVRPPPGDST